VAAATIRSCILPLAAALVLAGCSLMTAPVVNVSLETSVAEAVVAQDGVTEVTLTVRNLTRRTVELSGSGCMLTVRVMEVPPAPMVCTLVLRVIRLGPGETYSRTFTFRPAFPHWAEGPLEPGTYTLAGVLHADGATVHGTPVTLQVLQVAGAD
jgi:FtsP/CotA-like multicopper oxidase with cupredoxin domain